MQTYTSISGIFRWLGLLTLWMTMGLNSFGHETFLLPLEFQVKQEEQFKVLLITGTFDKSLYPLGEDGVDSLNLYGPNGSEAISLESWKSTNPDSKIWKAWQELRSYVGLINFRKTSSFEVEGLKTGTFILGHIQKLSRIALEKEKYEDYLLKEVHYNPEESTKLLDDSMEMIRESYLKCSKTIVQAGDSVTMNVLEPIGHAAEIVPMAHPAQSSKGDTLQFKLLLDGHPKANQPVIAGRDTGVFNKTADTIVILRSNEDGIVSLPLTHTGVWWVHFIHVEPINQNDMTDFTSKWGSLTFEIN